MPETTRRRLVRLLPEIGLMGTSLVLGLLIWLIASNQTFENVTLRIPVRAANVPANVEVQVPQEVDLWINLPTSLKNRLGDGDLELPLDLSDARRWAGIERFEETLLPLDPAGVRATRDLGPLLSSVQMEALSPSQALARARLITASFELQPRLVGEPASGFQLAGTPEIQPHRIWLTGAREDLEAAVDEAMVLWTDPIRIGDLDAGRHTHSPGVNVPEAFTVAGHKMTESDPLRRSLDGSLPDTLVVVTITEESSQRVIAGCGGSLPILRRDLALTRQEPERFTVTVEGPTSHIEALSPGDLEVIAPALLDIDRAGENLEVQVEARLSSTLTDQVRQEVRIITVEPDRARVTIEAVEETSFTSPSVSPEIP